MWRDLSSPIWDHGPQSVSLAPAEQYGREIAECAYRHILGGVSLDEVGRELWHGWVQRVMELCVDCIDSGEVYRLPLMFRVVEDLKRWPDVRHLAKAPPWDLTVAEWETLLGQLREERAEQRAKARRSTR